MGENLVENFAEAFANGPDTTIKETFGFENDSKGGHSGHSAKKGGSHGAASHGGGGGHAAGGHPKPPKGGGPKKH